MRKDRLAPKKGIQHMFAGTIVVYRQGIYHSFPGQMRIEMCFHHSRWRYFHKNVHTGPDSLKTWCSTQVVFNGTKALMRHKLIVFLSVVYQNKLPGQFGLYFSLIAPITISVKGPMTLLEELIAKNSPSDPVGASEAIQDICLGLHNTSPTVMDTCQIQAPTALGKIATNIADIAIIQRPVIFTVALIGIELAKHVNIGSVCKIIK